MLATSAGGQSNLTQPKFWKRQYYAKFNGNQALLYSDSLEYAKMTFGDLDGDGDLDLLLGKKDGHVNHFKNQGNPAKPNWMLVKENISARVPSTKQAGGFTVQAIKASAFASPHLADIDADGDLDMFLGDQKGGLRFFRNTGNPLLAIFQLESDNFSEEDYGSYLVPFLADVDQDRDLDLFLGNGAGELYFFPNTGNLNRPQFCMKRPLPDALPEDPLPCLPTPEKLFEIKPETHAAPALVDWNRNGSLDLFIGRSNGTISYFENVGTPFRADWRLRQPRFVAIDDGGFAAPAFININGDGLPEILIGNSSNYIDLYTSKGGAGLHDLWKLTDNAFGVQKFARDLERVVLTSGDLDGDGDMDLIAGERNGNLMLLENQGSPQQPAWNLASGNLLPGAPRNNSAPTLVDLDDDDDLDLLVGGQEGRLWLIRNVGNEKKAAWRLENSAFGGVDVGSNSVPIAIDLDDDGDMDLLVGNSRGFVIQYTNTGTPTLPNFRITSTRFAGISAGQSAAPALMDLDGNGNPNLVVGNREGTMILALSKPAAEKRGPLSWRLGSRNWLDVRVKGYSVPHFQDFNGDGKPDLLLGDGGGNTHLWLNALPAPEAESVKESGAPGAPANQAVAAAAPPPVTPPQGPLAPTQTAAPPPPATQTAANQAALGAVQGNKVNQSSPVEPQFALESDRFAGIVMEGRIAPAFHDLDGDGDLDLVVGVARGLLVHYENIGSPTEAKFQEKSSNFAEYGGARNPAPILADLDGDAKADLLVGIEDGTVLYTQNTGTEKQAIFKGEAVTLKGVNVRSNASPTVYFAAGDALPDLLVGNFAGKLLGYTNQASGGIPQFKVNDRGFLGLDIGVAASPYAGDLNLDQKVDLIVGSDQGNMLAYRPTAVTRQNPWGYQQYQGMFEGLKFPPGTTPRLVDIDGDGDQDLILGTERGRLSFYRNEAAAARGAPLQLQ